MVHHGRRVQFSEMQSEAMPHERLSLHSKQTRGLLLTIALSAITGYTALFVLPLLEPVSTQSGLLTAGGLLRILPRLANAVLLEVKAASSSVVLLCCATGMASYVLYVINAFWKHGIPGYAHLIATMLCRCGLAGFFVVTGVIVLYIVLLLMPLLLIGAGIWLGGSFVFGLSLGLIKPDRPTRK
jgi:hypothetical protein